MYVYVVIKLYYTASIDLNSIAKILIQLNVECATETGTKCVYFTICFKTSFLGMFLGKTC